MKYRFEIIYQNDYMHRASELMKHLDLDMGEMGIREAFLVTTKNDVPIALIKEKFILAFESSDLKVLKIEGDKIE